MQKFLNVQPVVFEPEVTQILVKAFDDAWASLQVSGARLDGHVVDAREILAKRIIETAKNGDRDPSRLVEDALGHLAKTISGHATGVQEKGRQ